MGNYLREHEKYMTSAMEDPRTDLRELASYHLIQIGFLQHERLIHLLVTLTVALLLMLSTGLSLLDIHPAFLAIDLILLVLLAFYIVHYYQLENAVQRWYAIYASIAGKPGGQGGPHA